MSASTGNSCQSVVLFHDGGHSLTQALRVRPHRHDYWQLQWVDGPWVFLAGSEKLMLSKNHLVLIPPGVLHGFEHVGKGETYGSILFQRPTEKWSGETLVIKGGKFIKAWIRCAEELVRAGSGRSSPLVMAPLIDALFAFQTAERPSPGEPALVKRARAYVESHPGSSLTVQGMAEFLGLNRTYLTGVFKKTTGQTVKHYIDQYRLGLAKGMLRFGDFSISQVADQLGYPDVFTFSKFFKKHANVTPSDYRKGRAS